MCKSHSCVFLGGKMKKTVFNNVTQLMICVVYTE